MKSRHVLSLTAGALVGALAWGCANDTQHEGRESVSAPAKSDAQLASSKVMPDEIVGNIETVAYFNGPMPTGVAVSHSGRIFVCYPKWGDPVKFTVAEIKNGEAVAYPDEKRNNYNALDPSQSLVSVQSVVIDPRDRLWLLDTGSTNMGPVISGAAKLVCVDLVDNTIAKTISFPATSATSSSYLNDVRFDLSRGAAGYAYITDSSATGLNGIVVVDLDSGRSWRRLNEHPSTKADRNFIAVVEGKQVPGIKMGIDGIALSNDGRTLYYRPLASRHLYSASAELLADRSKSDADVAQTVQDLGDRGFASDGLEFDAQGRLYLTDYEHNGIRVRESSGDQYRFIARGPQIIWPDTLCVANDGYLYFTNNQVNRTARFNNGADERKQPYTLMRVKTDGSPVMLTRSGSESK